MTVGGIILCGGKSSRMGRAKALLPVGEELMLQRVVRIVGSVLSPVVVVAAPEQELPDLPGRVIVVRDEREHLGPLAGLRIGLEALQDKADAGYCSSCDVPLLKVEFIEAVISRLGDYDVVTPQEGRFYHPLAAVYRTSLVPIAAQLVAEDRLRLMFLLDAVRTLAVDVDDLRAVDPALESLRNVNTPEEYSAVLEMLETDGS
ncbi:MAG: molybdenum cofactor guanylyltransferase [Planctomycetota bacterium]|nr:MAG: molybdenum cofactor guanylyltransferase [Planctomycetota bacterium]REK21559.1 MAG: molybdenum cofactor guanylyltransferase [Planctomycetota bacterium]REK39887.1 MAG: molybdenum cofactor guanylyltransferase [Planctomycetota bacterium]